MLARIQDSVAESVTITRTAGAGLTDPSTSLEFFDVTKFLVYNGHTAATNFATQNSEITLLLRASDNGTNIVRSFNKSVTPSITADPNNGSSATITPSGAFSFVDGEAEVTLTNSEIENGVQFEVAGSGGTTTCNNCRFRNKQQTT